MSLTGESDIASTQDGEGEDSPVTLDLATLRRKLVNDFVAGSLQQMRVFLRVRPLNQEERSAPSCLAIESSQSVLLKAPEQSATFRNHSSNEAKTKQRFTFSRVFGPKEDQSAFFNGACLSTVSDFVNGQNCLVFAYGTTNSGKTYTVQGNCENPGIIPHAVDLIFKSVGDRLDLGLNLRPLNTCHVEHLNPKSLDFMLTEKESLLKGTDEFYASVISPESEESRSLFETSSQDADVTELSIHESQNFRFRFWVSFSEIYNENIFDLLDTDPLKRKKLRLTLDRTGSNFIKGLRIIPVDSPKEARKLLSLGRKNLHIASTKLNHSSSRSHCIFTIYIVRVVDITDPQQAMINSLSFCDLAGSERVAKTRNTGERLKEAGKINNSLMVFARCIEALKTTQKSKERPVIPFRDSKLTQLFQLFFSGKGRASMIVNVSPTADLFDDTVNVLRISAIAKQVVTSDQLDKTCLNMTSASARLTDLWAKSNQRWSSFSKGREVQSKMSIMTIPDESASTEGNNVSEETLEEEPDIQELIDLVLELEGKYNALVDENVKLEVKLRAEMCQEFQSQMVDLENAYETRLEQARENAAELMEKRLDIAKKIFYESQTSLNKDSSDETSEDEMDDEEKTTVVIASNEFAELAQVTAERDLLSKDIGLLRDQLSEKEALVKELMQDSETKVQELEQERLAQIKELEQTHYLQIQELEYQRETEVKELERKREAGVKELERKLKEAGEAADSIKALHSMCEVKIQSAVEDLEKLGEILFEKDTEIGSLTDKLCKLEKESSSRQSLRMSLEKAKEVNRDRLAQSLADIQKMNDVLANKDLEIAGLQETISGLEKELSLNEKLKQKLVQKDKKVLEASSEVDRLQERISELEKELALSKTLKQKQVRNETKALEENSEVARLQETISCLEKERSQSETLKQTLKQVQKQNKSLEAENQRLSENNRELNAEVIQLSAELSRFQEDAASGESIKFELEQAKQENNDMIVQNLTETQQLYETIRKKDAEINLLKVQFLRQERIDSAEDFVPRASKTAVHRMPSNSSLKEPGEFKQPSVRATRRGRRPKENVAPTQNISLDSTSSEAEEPVPRGSKSHSTSSRASTKSELEEPVPKGSKSRSTSSRASTKSQMHPANESMRSPLAILDYIKQSPPVQAAKYAYDSIMESIKPKCDNNVSLNTTGRRLRRKLYREDSQSQLECTPPKQPVVEEPVHSIVKRKLRSKK